MNGGNILVFLIVAGALVIVFTMVTFTLFSRFLNREKEKAERFREIHLKPPDER
jgi:hypothetical protein